MVQIAAVGSSTLLFTYTLRSKWLSYKNITSTHTHTRTHIHMYAMLWLSLLNVNGVFCLGSSSVNNGCVITIAVIEDYKTLYIDMSMP